jgi:aldose 1-epimerase
MPNGRSTGKNGEVVRLRAGDLALELAPWLGGAVVALRHSGSDLLRPTPPEALRQGLVRQSCAFPLVPFSNRIARGRFAFGGEQVQLALSPADPVNAVHGNGYRLPWRVAELGAASCTLELEHVPSTPDARAAWPYAYYARQSFVLSETGLRVGLTLENRDDRSMPGGLGWHPFFPLRADTTLSFGARSVWLTDEGYLPTRKIAVPAAWNDDRPRLVQGTTINNCFEGWTGVARIGLGGGLPDLVINASSSLGMAIVYVPAGADFFAFEPVSHMPDAINRAEGGMVILEPGQQLAGSIDLTLAAAAPPQ